MALDRLTKVDGGGISTTSDYRVGIITATKFVGPIEGDVTGSITATDGTFSGNVTIGGTLTYEDVTNIDSVGIITARKGVRVTADGSNSSNYISIGAGNDTKLYHSGSHSYIKHTGTGNFYLDINTDDLFAITMAESEHLANFTGNGAVELFHNGTKRIETTSSGVSVTGQGVFSSAITASTYIQGTSSNGGLKFYSDGSTSTGVILDTNDHLTPTTNNVSDLGSSSLKWRNIFAKGDLDVDGHTNLDNVSIAGVSTHTGLAQFANTINLTHASAGQNYIYFNEDLQFAKNGTGTRLKIDSSGKVNIGNTGSSWVGPLSIGSGASGQGQVLQIYSNSDTYGAIFFGDADSGAGRYVGSINYYHDNNYMRFDTAGAERLRIDSSGINVSGIVTAQAFVPTAQGRFPRNIIINGGALVAQRAGDATEVQVDGYGSVDRFALRYSGTDEAPVQLQSQPSVSDSGDNPYKAGLTRAFHVRNGNQTSGAGSADYMVIQQRLEAADLRNSGWDYTNPNSFVTLSYYVKSNVAQNFYVTLKTNDGTPQKYAMETGSLSVQTWKRVTHKIPGNSNLQFDENTDEGLEIEWSLFRGTDQTGSMSLNAWAAQNNSVRTPDQTSTWYTTDNSNFELTGVQLELGPAATPFEIKSFADELRSCQRYCFRIGGGSAETGTTLAMGVQSHSNLCKSYIQFPTTTRSKDMTFTFSELSLDDDVAGYAANRINSVNSESSGKNAASLIFNTDTMGTVRVTRVVADAVGGYIQGECEL